MPDTTATSLRVALLTTPVGLEMCRYLSQHLRVAGIVIDHGPWGKPKTLTARLRRDARHLLERMRQPSRFAWAELGAPTYWTTNINSARAGRALARWNADLGIVVGGRIIKRETFAVPRLGTINKHSSLLPRHRGLAAEYWCLYHEDLDSLGVTVHFVDDGCDTGPILVQKPMPFRHGDTPGSLRQRSEEVGREAIVQAVCLIAGTGTRGVPQNELLATLNRKPTETTDRELELKLPQLWRKYAA